MPWRTDSRFLNSNAGSGGFMGNLASRQPRLANRRKGVLAFFKNCELPVVAGAGGFPLAPPGILPQGAWVQTLAHWDIAVFRWINRSWSDPTLDSVMRFLSGNPYFVPALVLIGAMLLWKGGVRGWVFVLLLSLAAAFSNEFLVEPLKHWVQRPRPYAGLSDVVLRVGRGTANGSTPSGHAMNAALMATFTAWFYPRARWWVIAMAFGVALSRVYNGAHYPSDVVAGALLGITSGLFSLWGAERLWSWASPRWWPDLGKRVPSLLHPAATFEPAPALEGMPQAHG